jgi:hypothetical protein
MRGVELAMSQLLLKGGALRRCAPAASMGAVSLTGTGRSGPRVGGANQFALLRSWCTASR